ncbi:hypothetical protein [Methanolobus psychrotolerans]|uniref:hypothetical protein n=1 Tax=Methanolobus psychrotolerans TaxID=1874706 RepID=UPI00101AEAD4|nr:hypothetical protein [Methanolobus psychrotolerans]
MLTKIQIVAFILEDKNGKIRGIVASGQTLRSKIERKRTKGMKTKISLVEVHLNKIHIQE